MIGLRKRPLLIASLLLISGCAYRGPSPSPLHPWDLYNTYMRIEARKTTKEEIEGWLGAPYLKTRDNLGREKWIYKTTSPFTAQTRLDLTFDRDGRVILYFLEGEGDREARPEP